ncbi:MAG: LysR family transcriptional regulator [Myxococcales bacterium]|nr:LysR family transcriptional regulator [Myxococcales bacterium]
MDLDEIRALIAVAESGSYQAAARNLGWSRATLKRRIDALEARVGSVLLSPTDTGSVLSDDGIRVLHEGRHLLHHADSFLKVARQSDSEPSGEVRLTAPLGLPPWMLNELLQFLATRMPKVRWQMSHLGNPKNINPSETDLLGHFGTPLDSASWTSIRVVRAQLRLLASKTYLTQHGVPTSADELRKHRLFYWRPYDFDRTTTIDTPSGRLSVEPSITSDDVNQIRTLASTGRGLAWAPDRVSLSGSPEGPFTDISPDNLVALPETLASGWVEAFISLPKVLENDPKTRFVREAFERLFADGFER